MAKLAWNGKVLVVMLRQPRMTQRNEMRSDPFWEYGSFGLTGCHQRNLLHPKNACNLTGSRLAFVQGGKAGSKLVFLTPPVTATALADRCEVRWAPAQPICYDSAPVVVTFHGDSDLKELKALVSDVRRNGWMGKFASRFRSRTEALPDEVVAEMLKVWRQRYKQAKRAERLASTYVDALPVTPPLVDKHRRKTYRQLARRVGA